MSSLEFFQVDSLNPAYTVKDGVLYDKSMTTLIAYPAARKTGFFQIPDGVTHIAGGAFNRAPIDSLFIPNSVISIGSAAFYESKLSNVVLSENITEIKPHTFAKCTNLTSIVIPDSVIFIGHNAFDGTPWYNSQEGIVYIGKVLYRYKGKMSPKTEITIPDGIRAISYGAFRDQTGLVKITLPESLEYIEGWVFSDCKNLKSIHIPQSVKSINEITFSRSGLKEINVYWQEPSSVDIRDFREPQLHLDSREDKVMWTPMSKSKLIVPKSTKEKYEHLGVWKYYEIVERKR